MRKIAGGCLCGRIRFNAEADPILVAVCHCKNCQKQAGTAFTTVIGVPDDSFKVEGILSTYLDSETGSGTPMQRNFCPNCGSPVTTKATYMPAITWIKAGTLDDVSWVQPAMEIFCDQAQPWVPRFPKMQAFPGMPPLA